jgi:ribose/xylose/arabinose/galactoside ABC-type transport system permease subunit
MSKWFAEEPVHGNRLWWLVALIIGIAAVLTILFHFSSHGWNVESTGNQEQVHLTK